MEAIQNIVEELKKDLPGPFFQNRMSPIKDNTKYRIAPEDHKVACVLALLHYKVDSLYMTFIKRAASHPDDKHAGQIGFPGGKIESLDNSHEDCALRETEEELGIPISDISIIGSLTPIYIFASNFKVYPFIGFLDKTPNYIPELAEVASVIEVKIEELLAHDSKISKPMQLRKGNMTEVPGYRIKDDFLWGATAMITSEIEQVFENVFS